MKALTLGKVFFFLVSISACIPKESDHLDSKGVESHNLAVEGSHRDTSELAEEQQPWPKPTHTISDTALIERLRDSMFRRNRNGEVDSALQLSERALETAKNVKPLNNSLVLTVLTDRAYLFSSAKQTDQAIACIEEGVALEASSEITDSAELGSFHNIAGIIFRRSRQPQRALEHYYKALTIRKAVYGPVSLPVAKTYNNLGGPLFNIGKYSRAIFFRKKALEIKEQILDSTSASLAISHYGLGNTYRRMGNHKQAIYHLKRCIDIYSSRENPDYAQITASLNGLGLVNMNMGDYKSCFVYFDSAVTINLRMKEKDGIYLQRLAPNYNNIGNAYREMGKLQHALAYHQKSLSMSKSIYGDSSIQVAQSYHNIGNVLVDMELSEEAISYYQRALAVKKYVWGENHWELGMTLNNMGYVEMNHGDYNAAEKYLKRSLLVYANTLGENHYEAVLPNLNLGILYRCKSEHVKSRLHLRRAFDIQIAVNGKYDDLTSEILFEIGNTFTAEDRYEKARFYLKAALEAMRYRAGSPDPFEQVNSLLDLQEVFHAYHNYYLKREREASGNLYLDSLKHNLERMLMVEEKLQQNYTAKTTRQLYADQALPAYEWAIDVLLRLDSPAELPRTFTLAEKTKSRQLTEKLQFDANGAAFGLPDSLLQREYDLDVDIAYYDKRVFQQRYEADSSATRDSLLQVYESRLFDLRLQRDTLRELLQTQYPAYHRLRYSQEVISLAEVQDSLLGQAHDALVEYFVGDSNVFTWVVLPDTFYVWPTKLDFPLDQWVTDLRCALLAEQDTALRCSASYAPTAYHLYQRLFAPVDSLLPAQASVLIVPDGVLGYLPFETLLTKSPDPGSTYADYPYLLRDHPLSYAYSATLQREMQRKQHPQPPRRNLLAVAPAFEGNPTAQDTALLASRFIDTTDRRNYLTPLRHNVAEADNIAAQLGGDALLGAEATEAAFVQQAGHYRILHLSTHGKANDQAGDYSFLAFHPIEDDSAEVENEWLYNQELYNLQLNADLVVLSACETGIGELQRGEGIISLARGFSYAGAKSLVTSLWNVNDRSTKELMESFYGYLAEGRPKHEALRQAKLDYLATHPAYLQSPFFWAAFIPIGDMKAVEVKRDYTWWWVGGLGVSLLIVGLLGLWYARRS